MIARPNVAITRKEFYVALAVLWIYLSFAFKPGGLQLWMTYTIWAASLVLGFAYSVLALRNRKMEHKDDVSA